MPTIDGNSNGTEPLRSPDEFGPEAHVTLPDESQSASGSDQKFTENPAILAELRLFVKKPSRNSDKVALYRLLCARDALRHVRNSYYTSASLKSTNKLHSFAEPSSEIRRIVSASTEVSTARQAFAKGLGIEAFKRSQAHNCGELAALAADYLANTLDIEVRRLRFGPQGTGYLHGVVLLADDVLPELETDFASWPSNATICDPWANIACLAQDYPAAFIAKMQKWEAAGKLIRPFVNHNQEWIPATAPEWIDAVLHGKREVVAVPSS
ncbi:hypothetical protein LJR230_002143 [Trinickia sp. LjRoot230]|uniref:hypothetical protein n=1 Tax=Trinickia sp. LjRoot230 TaxID=3342288 RepID=UPI003ECDE14D